MLDIEAVGCLPNTTQATYWNSRSGSTQHRCANSTMENESRSPTRSVVDRAAQLVDHLVDGLIDPIVGRCHPVMMPPTPREAELAERFPKGAAVGLEDLEAHLHPTVHHLRGSEPVSWLPALGGWYATSRESVISILRDPATFTVDDPRFSTARVLGPSMLSLDGSEHDRHRDPFADLFRGGEAHRPTGERVREMARSLVQGVRASGSAELRGSLAAPLAVTVISEALGLQRVEAGLILDWYRAIVGDVSTITAGGEPSDQGAAAVAGLRGAVDDAISAGPETPLGRIAGGCDLDLDELTADVGVIMFGAIETSEGMTANALWHLLSHPEQLDAVRRHPELTSGAVEESLRLEPAACVVDRYATTGVRLAGADIEAGEPVTVSLAGANRDPATFADPDRFDVERHNARLHVSFVRGPHTCLGMHLARLETIAAIEAVAALDGLRIDRDSTEPPRGLVFRKPPAVVAHWDAC